MVTSIPFLQKRAKTQILIDVNPLSADLRGRKHGLHRQDAWFKT
jgi:hypothetical protein